MWGQGRGDDQARAVHGWITQRRLVGVTAAAALSSVLAQTALHAVLSLSGTKLVFAESAIWRALGIHRFEQGSEVPVCS
jgi:hypothetical protein